MNEEEMKKEEEKEQIAMIDLEEKLVGKGNI